MRNALIAFIIAWWATAAVGAPSTRSADLPDDEFRAQIQAFTTAHHRAVLSWGTLQLDGSSRAYRFAGLGVELGPDNAPARAADRTGAYIIEAAPARFWLIAYPWDATTFHVSDDEGPDGHMISPPPWLVLDDTSIEHGQNHNHGKAYVWFGLRGNKLVVTEAEDSNVRRDPEVVHHVFTEDGTCGKRCRPLATYDPALLRVVGSARTISALPAF